MFTFKYFFLLLHYENKTAEYQCTKSSQAELWCMTCLNWDLNQPKLLLIQCNCLIQKLKRKL